MDGWADTMTQASAHATSVDVLSLSFIGLAFVLSAPVFILMAIFAIRYRRGREIDRTHPIDRRVGWEIAWAIIPFILTLGFYVWSTRLFFELHTPPDNAIEIDVLARQWMWKFQHAGGQREINTLHVPIGEAVKLTMASQDVIHSLYIPALRIKQDVLPGRYTTLWFTPTTAGTYRFACTQFCGTDHSEMVGAVTVMSSADFARWLTTSGTDQSLAAAGASLFRAKGCSGCHGEAPTVHAPPLEGLYGGQVALADGTTVTADEQYIRDSILLPQKQLAAGYPPIMPTYQNILGEDEVLQLVAYLKSLGNAGGAS